MGMDWHAILGIASGALTVLSGIPYILSILRHETKPNAVSWILWTALQLIAIAAQISAGTSWSVILVIAATVNTSVVSILALSGYGYEEYGWLDYTCAASAVVAIILWQLTGEPALAILLAILADMLAATPTVIKTYRDPYSENLTGWAIITVASMCGVASTSLYNLANLAYPVYLLLIDGTLFSMAYIRRFAVARDVR